MHFPRFLLTVNHPPLFLTHTSFKFEPTADPTTFAPIKPAEEAPNPLGSLSLFLFSDDCSSKEAPSTALLPPPQLRLAPPIPLPRPPPRPRQGEPRPRRQPKCLQGEEAGRQARAEAVLPAALHEAERAAPAVAVVVVAPRAAQAVGAAILLIGRVGSVLRLRIRAGLVMVHSSQQVSVTETFAGMVELSCNNRALCVCVCRSLLYRPLPLDVGRCTCIIAKERTQDRSGMSLYTLYTNVSFLLTLSEGQGRQDRKLAVAWHRRRNGRSEFIVAQNPNGIFCSSDESFLGSITANLMGSKYQIWDQVVDISTFMLKYLPTITTITGHYRSLRAWIPKYQSMQLKNSNATQVNSTIILFTKRHELDFRERAGRTGGPRIQSSVKNFQLTTEAWFLANLALVHKISQFICSEDYSCSYIVEQEKGRQTILQLGKIGKSKYVMDYRQVIPLFKAFIL
ncbi:hypothetical protein GW17_00005338 [Ensete ventricosum]|nr:hypothetical protein GW17_00005338 [Ensete ventricosum]